MTTNAIAETLTIVELKTLGTAIDWEHVGVDWGYNDGSTRAETVRQIMEQLCERVRRNMRGAMRILNGLRFLAKTPIAAYYVKRLAMRTLHRMQVLLRQKLASSAPVERLILRNRARQLFAARPPIAPPHFA
jgi:hypothetical protein